MKIKLLKRLRIRSWNKYEICNWGDIAGCPERPWRICTGPHSALAYHEYKTREDAVKAAKQLWHEDAKKYLWEHRIERNHNKYPW